MILDGTLGIIRFREGDAWICAWLHYDIMGQGSTPEAAYESFVRALAAEVLIRVADGKDPLEGIEPPPPDQITLWRAMAAMSREDPTP